MLFHQGETGTQSPSSVRFPVTSARLEGQEIGTLLVCHSIQLAPSSMKILISILIIRKLPFGEKMMRIRFRMN